MTTDHPTSHAAEGDSAFVDRLRALGLVRKGAVSASPAPPTPPVSPSAPSGAEDVGLLARRIQELGLGRKAPASAAMAAPVASPYGTLAEIPPPIGVTRAAGPIVRHFRVTQPKTQHRAMGTVTRRPDPAA